MKAARYLLDMRGMSTKKTPLAITSSPADHLFGGDVPDEVRALIESSRHAARDQAASILWSARALSPSCLPVYYLLYKLHASRGELAESERAARLGLAEAGRQAGLPSEVGPGLPAPRLDLDFDSPGTPRFWLFTLKALAFIAVRAERLDEAAHTLAWIAEFDPRHSVGSDVTAALLNAVS